MKRHIILLTFLFSFQVALTQTFHAINYDQYETYLTTQTKEQAMLSSGHKKILADFNSIYKTNYKLFDSLFPSIESAINPTLAAREKPDTVFHIITTGHVTFIGNLKRNDSIIYRIFNVLEESVFTTIDSTFKKRKKSYANYILDTKGMIKGKIQDFGNHTFKSIQNDKLLMFSNKNIPGKTSFIDPFSKDLRTFLKSDTSNLYIFAEVNYFKNTDKEVIRAD